MAKRKPPVVVTSDYNSFIAPDNPTHHYKLSASGADRIGTRNLTTSGGVTFGVAGIVGGSDSAVQFDGSGRLTSGSENSATYTTAPITYELWVEPSSIGTKMGVLHYAAGTSDRMGISILADGRVEFWIRQSDSSFVTLNSTQVLQAGNRYLLQWIWNGSTLAGVVNGQSAGTPLAATTHRADGTITHRLGGYVSDGFVGKIDEFAIYATALSTLRCQVHYAGGGGRTDLARGKSVVSSSDHSAPYLAAFAVDGDEGTRWASATGGAANTKQWRVDLGDTFSIGEVGINWEAAYAPTYTLETSLDGTNWTTAASTTASGAGLRTTTFAARNARHVRITATSYPSGLDLISFWTFSVYTSVASPSLAVVVTVNRTTSSGTSLWRSGYTNVDRQWLHPWGGQSGPYTSASTAQGQAYAREAETVNYKNVHIMGWGVDMLWPTETASPPDFTHANENGHYGMIDRNVKSAADHGVTPIITLAMAPTWMVGARGAGNTVVLPSDMNALNYDGRVLTDKMPKWLALVDAIVRRFVQAPYNVRNFQIWNEFKGYYNPDINNWDAGLDPGTAGKADMGYTYFYNQTRAQVLSSAAAVGVNSGIRTGGPYVVNDTHASSVGMSHPMNTTLGSSSSAATGQKSYGTIDARPLDAMRTWLAGKTGAEFIIFRFSNSNWGGGITGNEFSALQLAGDLASWIRGLSNTTYPGATTLPLWNAELYTFSDIDPTNGARMNAIAAESHRIHIESGYEVALRWGSTGLDNVNFWTATNTNQDSVLMNPATDGLQGNSYQGIKLIKDNFGNGTLLYPVTVNDSSKISAMANRTDTLLINKTDAPLSLTLDGNAITLSAYEVKLASALPWLRTSGKDIVVANTTKKVVPRGVNMYRDWENNSHWESFAFPHLRDNWKGNIVFRGFAGDPVLAGNAAYLGKLDDYVEFGRKHGIYVVFSWRGDVQEGPMVTQPSSTADDALVALAHRYKGQSHVMFSLMVEPHDVTWATLRPIWETMIDQIRAATAPYVHLIFVPGTAWSFDISGAVSNPVNRPHIVYKTHSYNPPSGWQAAWGVVHDANLPVFVGEFGPNASMTQSDVDALYPYMNTRQVGYAAWAYEFDGTPSLIDTTFTPTNPYGVGARADMLNTAAIPEHTYTARTNLATGKTATASEFDSAGYEASKSTDGVWNSSWRSPWNNSLHWLRVDLGSNMTISTVEVNWEATQYSTSYNIEVSTDGTNWTNVANVSRVTRGRLISTKFTPVSARYVRVNNMTRVANQLIIWELGVYA